MDGPNGSELLGDTGTRHGKTVNNYTTGEVALRGPVRFGKINNAGRCSTPWKRKAQALSGERGKTTAAVVAMTAATAAA